jgi:glycosyltransferase involved in cell wall biosynthesis
MRILFAHQHFPAQFKHLVPRLLDRGDQIWALRQSGSKQINNHTNLRINPYKLSRCNGVDTHPLLLETESKVIRGMAAATQAIRLHDQGLTPDLIVGHPGWGEMLFLSDIWPQVPQLHYLEFFYGVPGTDHDIDDIHAKSSMFAEQAKLRLKNANLLLSLHQMSQGISPTFFQRSLFPEWAQNRCRVIHDGIDLDWLLPKNSAQLVLPTGQKLRAGDPVVTFINRTFEPYRGIHIFLDALVRIQKLHSAAQVILVGEDTPQVSYGSHRKDQVGWLTYLRKQHADELDWNRIHCLGTIPHSLLKTVYQVSAVHVYFTYPFVLSWSMLEAMACGCLVVGSATQPVEEVIHHGDNGFLVPFHDSKELAAITLKALHHPQSMVSIRRKARKSMSAYGLPRCLEQQIKLIDELVSI